MKCPHCNDEADYCETIDVWDNCSIEKWYCPTCDIVYTAEYIDEKLSTIQEIK